MTKELIVKSILCIVTIISVFLGNEVKAETRNNNPLLIEITIDGKEIEPKFDQFITDYVIAVDKEKIQIDAITDDPNASCEIIGDTNLKIGINEFEIKVTAEDKKTTMSYYLHITRTDNIEKANATLKSLEVDGFELSPRFNEKDINYYIQYNGIIDKLNIKAIPENENAKVEITGNENYNAGSVQLIKIKVTAEDNKTTKIYQITAKKEGEDVENPQGLEEYEKELQQEKNKEQINKNSIYLLLGICGIIVVIIIFCVYKKRKR